MKPHDSTSQLIHNLVQGVYGSSPSSTQYDVHFVYYGPFQLNHNAQNAWGRGYSGIDSKYRPIGTVSSSSQSVQVPPTAPPHMVISGGQKQNQDGAGQNAEPEASEWQFKKLGDVTVGCHTRRCQSGPVCAHVRGLQMELVSRWPRRGKSL